MAGLGPAEQVVAAALASAGAEPKNEKQLKHLLHDSGVQIIIQELQDAPQILQDWDLIEEIEGKKYRFRVELLRRWIAENKPLHQAQGKLDALDPEANELYKVAKNFYKSNRFEAAIGSLRQVISINPHHVKAHLQLADILIKQQQDNEAREILEQLYGYNPAAARNPLVDVLLSLAKLSGDKREQRKLYERVLEIEPKHGEAKRILQTIKRKKYKMGSPREELVHLFNEIVLADNEIDAIITLDEDGEILISNTVTDSMRPDAIFFKENARNIAASLYKLKEVHKVFVEVEKELRRGYLEYTVFQLSNGIVLMYFLVIDGRPTTVAVITSTNDGLGLILRAMRKTIDRIRILMRNL